MPDFLEPFRSWFRDPGGLRKLLAGLAWLAGSALAMVLGLILMIRLDMLRPWLALAGLAVPILGMVTVLYLVGYGCRLLRNVQSGTGHPLPEWQYFRENAGVGFRYLLALCLWSLPLWLLLWLLGLLLGMKPMELIWERVYWGLPGQPAGDIWDIFQMLSAPAGHSRAGSWLLGILALLYMLGMTLLAPGIAVAFSRGDLGRALNLPVILAWTGRHRKPLVISILALALAEWLLAALINMLGMMLLPSLGWSFRAGSPVVGHALNLPVLWAWTGLHWKPVLLLNALALTLAKWLLTALIHGLMALGGDPSLAAFVNLNLAVAVLPILFGLCTAPPVALVSIPYLWPDCPCRQGWGCTAGDRQHLISAHRGGDGRFGCRLGHYPVSSLGDLPRDMLSHRGLG